VGRIIFDTDILPGGFAAEQKLLWIDGVPPPPQSPRWCLTRDMLHWVK